MDNIQLYPVNCLIDPETTMWEAGLHDDCCSCIMLPWLESAIEAPLSIKALAPWLLVGTSRPLEFASLNTSPTTVAGIQKPKQTFHQPCLFIGFWAGQLDPTFQLHHNPVCSDGCLLGDTGTDHVWHPQCEGSGSTSVSPRAPHGDIRLFLMKLLQFWEIIVDSYKVFWKKPERAWLP